jgi:UDP-galactopyranose mutase
MNNIKYDFLIIGAGITGITISRILAESGKRVLIVERRNHIGGNCYDCHDENGILIHKYGPHIFHTNYKEVWDFLSQFTEWSSYQHKVRAYVDGKLVPFPINLDTVNYIYNQNFDSAQMVAYLETVKIPVNNMKNSRDAVITKIGTDLYEKFYKNYTLKQWGIPAEELDASVCQRIPVRFNTDDRYFDDKYQGIPIPGYTKLFEKMLSNENIHLQLDRDYRDVQNAINYKKLVCTGPIDEFFNFCYGKLGYRSLSFNFKNYTTDSFQDYAVINYPNDYDFTRITEYKKITGQKADSTTVSREYPGSEGEPFYPMPTEKNYNIYKLYMEKNKKEKNVVFAGRLGTYRYLNMDVACLEGIKEARKLLNET